MECRSKRLKRGLFGNIKDFVNRLSHDCHINIDCHVWTACCASSSVFSDSSITEEN